MSKQSYRTKRRNALFLAQDGLCYWCGCQTIQVEMKPRQRQPGNLATLDHLRDRTNPKRREDAQGQNDVRYVMACFDCNNGRGNATGRMIRRQAMQEQRA
jgi:hypothetical protein